MGRSSITISPDIYGHMLKDADRDAIDRLEIALGSKRYEQRGRGA
jgi:hypothetical protein